MWFKCSVNGSAEMRGEAGADPLCACVWVVVEPDADDEVEIAPTASVPVPVLVLMPEPVEKAGYVCALMACATTLVAIGDGACRVNLGGSACSQYALARMLPQARAAAAWRSVHASRSTDLTLLTCTPSAR